MSQVYPNTYHLSQRYRIYKHLRDQDIIPSQMMIAGGANSVGNMLYALPKISNKISGNGSFEIGIASYPLHLDRFEQIIKKQTSLGNLRPIYNIHRLETKQDFFEWGYEKLHIIKDKLRKIGF